MTPAQPKPKEVVLSPDELRQRLASRQADAQKSLAIELGMMRVDNPTFKVFAAAIEHCRAAELAMDMSGEYCRRLKRYAHG